MGVEESIGLAIRRALELGAQEAEAYACRVKRTMVSFNSKVRIPTVSISSGIAVRLVLDKRVGFYAVSSLDRDEVLRAAELAYKVARVSPRNERWVSLPERLGETAVEGTFDRETAEFEPEGAVEVASSLIERVKSRSEKVDVSEGLLACGTGEVAVGNSYGDLVKGLGTGAMYWLTVKAEEAGAMGSAGASDSCRRLGGLDFAKVDETVKRALDFLHPVGMETARVPVVIHGEVFSGILSVMFSRTLAADSVQEGRSPWIGKVGTAVADERVTLVDDGALPGGIGTLAFDDEGTPVKRSPLIEKGVLKGYLYDNYRARIEGKSSTGNAVKPNLQTQPLPMPHNLVLGKGDASLEELIREAKRGLYVVETIGHWLSNPIACLLNATVTHGYLIENGELTKPVTGVTISGNFAEILKTGIALYENTLHKSGWFMPPIGYYSPSVFISQLTVSGK